jgi:hypothetical protein
VVVGTPMPTERSTLDRASATSPFYLGQPAHPSRGQNRYPGAAADEPSEVSSRIPGHSARRRAIAFAGFDGPTLMPIRIAKWLFLAAVVIGVVNAMWAVFCHNVHASLGYVVEARFEKMPPNDKALMEWLRSQPGVIPHLVAIGRFDDGKLLYVSFTMSQNLAGQPPFPDLNGQVSSLGYTGSDGPFRDAADRTRTITMD